MKLKLLKTSSLPIMFFLLLLSASGCKKDKLEVNEEKNYFEIDHVSTGPYDGGWSLTLYPDGTADVVPGGDISYRGPYKINGSKIKIKTEQNSGSYTFEIISDTEIREKEYGIRLKLN